MTKPLTKTRLFSILFTPFVADKVRKAAALRGESLSELIRRGAEREADLIISK